MGAGLLSAHDEIVHALGDGWYAAWDTTKTDPIVEKRMEAVVNAQVAHLVKILSDTPGS